jgi:ribonuclease HI
MELLLEARPEAVEIFGDSKLVISQLTEEYRCESGLVGDFSAHRGVQVWERVALPVMGTMSRLIAQFRYINFYWIPMT